VSRTPSAAALRPIATSEGLYTILAIDHGRSLQRHLDLADGAEAHRRLLATKQAVVGLLAEYCSAVLLDAGVEQRIAERAWSGYQHEFGGRATRAQQTADDVDFDSALMRLAAGGTLPTEPRAKD